VSTGQFTAEQLRQLEELLGRQFSERINPLRRQSLGDHEGRPYYGILQARGGGAPRYITDPNDPALSDPNSQWSRVPIDFQGTQTGFSAQNRQQELDAAAANQDDVRFDTIQRLNRQMREQAGGQLNETGNLLQELRRNLSGGFDAAEREQEGAMAEIQGQGQTARRDILERESRTLGETTNRLRSQGLGSTTIVHNAGRAIKSGTNRDLSSLYEQMAGQRAGARTNMANFRSNRANAEYGAGRDLTDFMERRTGTETGLLMQGIAPYQRRSDLYHELQMARLSAAHAARGGSGGNNGLAAVAAIAPIAAALI
jgi:hypothetical protein